MATPSKQPPQSVSALKGQIKLKHSTYFTGTAPESGGGGIAAQQIGVTADGKAVYASPNSSQPS